MTGCVTAKSTAEAITATMPSASSAATRVGSSELTSRSSSRASSRRAASSVVPTWRYTVTRETPTSSAMSVTRVRRRPCRAKQLAAASR